MHYSHLGCCFSQKKAFLLKGLNKDSFFKGIKYHHAYSTNNIRNLGTVMNVKTPNQSWETIHISSLKLCISATYHMSVSSGIIFCYNTTYRLEQLNPSCRENRTMRFNCGVILNKGLTKILLLPPLPF